MKTKFALWLFVCVSGVAVLPARNANAQVLVYDATLTGPAESPPNASPGLGFAEVTINLALNTLRVEVAFSNLLGTTTVSHIHTPTATPGSGTAGVATQTPSFAGFPAGVTSGSYDSTFDMMMSSTWNPAYEAANGGTAATAETAFVAEVAAGEAYLDIHTTVFPGGEIRGFLAPAVPEPAPISLLVLGAIGLAGVARKSFRR